MDLSLRKEGDKQFQNAGEGVFEATNGGGIHGTSVIHPLGFLPIFLVFI